MPAQLSGLQSFGSGPPAPSNALPNTPFNSMSSSAGTGVGNLGQFGGYIPTPLPQFNNYTDYMSIMPGAPQMDYAASQWNPEGFKGLMQNLNAPNVGPGGSSINNAMEWAQEMFPRIQNTVENQWMPAANQQFDFANTLFGIAPQLFGDANTLRGQAPQFFEQIKPYLNQIQGAMGKAEDVWTQAADPQQALYNRTLQQTQDQQRAALEARGVDMTPYGAGVEGSALNNFNIDWQNNLLQRKLAGAQGYSGLMGTAAQMGQAGGSMAQTGSGLLEGAGALDQGGAMLGQTAQGMQQGAAAMQQMGWDTETQAHNAPMEAYAREIQRAEDQMNQYQGYNQAGSEMWQNIQNQFLTANQQGFNQNQTAGFEDPFAMLQLQSQIEMQREQMNMQEEMQKKQMQQQMMMQGAQAGMGMMGGMGGK